MKIEKIELIRIAIPFESGREKKENAQQDYNAASPLLSKMETLLIKIHADNGLYGWGEAFGHLSNPVTYAALENLVAPFFIGRQFSSVSDIETLMKEAEVALHGFGRTGPVRYALSAVDIGLWDLLGKHQQTPLWYMLGATRHEIGLYPSLVSYDNDPHAIAQKVQEVVDSGYSEIKLHETQWEAIATARAVMGDERSLMVDVNCPWSPEEAFAHAQRLTDLNLKWLEEPVWPPEDVRGLAALREAGVPLAAGENAAGEGDFIHLILHHAVDFLQPSVCKVGGITAMLRVIKLAQAHQVKVIPHCFYYGAGMLATAHLVAMLPSDVRLEVPYLQWPTPLHPFLHYQPTMPLPTLPGLGFEPDSAVVAEHLLMTTCCTAAKENAHV
ncbi:mandelate racemase/muconate lactonizing enzyme family protein [uncultured Cedecea sp.]|uniref:mandelate racemase/muconate lactonizing enzyme family protein n=1 Tax=uncultured Cedecea sp. TaxID=988762 RepID=UPI002604BD0D|nr:mandelate racemase/muconate lactonizing enzyme family protein [uncultured Cedecea sp.]